MRQATRIRTCSIRVETTRSPDSEQGSLASSVLSCGHPLRQLIQLMGMCQLISWLLAFSLLQPFPQSRREEMRRVFDANLLICMNSVFE